MIDAFQSPLGRNGRPDEIAALRADGAPARSARMERVTVYHNPSCGKSRGALDILRERGVACDVVEYLQAPPDRATYERFLALLAGPPADLVRKDKRFKELGLDAARYQTREQVLALLLEHPELMEMMLPILRADFSICDTYEYSQAAPLPCPISAFGGFQDADVPRQNLEAWRVQTSSSFTLRMLPGKHFFLHSNETLFLNMLAIQLRLVI